MSAMTASRLAFSLSSSDTLSFIDAVYMLIPIGKRLSPLKCWRRTSPIQGFELPLPIERASARYDANAAGWNVSQFRQQAFTPNPLLEHGVAISIPKRPCSSVNGTAALKGDAVLPKAAARTKLALFRVPPAAKTGIHD
ncbi:hypothetical protein ACUXV3_09110 [Roseobacteraceae bacterium NS-SX3]